VILQSSEPAKRRRSALDRFAHRPPVIAWEAPPRIVEPAKCAPDPDGYGMGYLGADNGHGYLSGGGAATGEIRINIVATSISGAGGSTTATCTIITTGTHTSFSVLLQYAPDPYGGAILTTDLAGFSETGWALTGEISQNTITRASVPPGTHVITFSIGPINLNPSRITIDLNVVTSAPTSPKSDQLPTALWVQNPGADAATIT